MKLYMRSRHLVAVVVAMTLLAAGNVLAGGKLITLIASGEPVMMPYRYVLTLFIAAVAVASLDSPLPETDRGDTGPLLRTRRAHLLSLMTIAVALSACAEQLTQGDPWAAARSCLCWFGFSLISGVVLRESLSWVVPMLVLFPLVWWGSATGAPASWNWATAPANSGLSWAVALGSLTVGLVAAFRPASTTR